MNLNPTTPGQRTFQITRRGVGFLVVTDYHTQEQGVISPGLFSCYAELFDNRLLQTVVVGRRAVLKCTLSKEAIFKLFFLEDGETIPFRFGEE